MFLRAFRGEHVQETQDQQDLWRFTHPSMPEDHIAALHELALDHAKRDCPEQASSSWSSSIVFSNKKV